MTGHTPGTSQSAESTVHPVREMQILLTAIRQALTQLPDDAAHAVLTLSGALERGELAREADRLDAASGRPPEDWFAFGSFAAYPWLRIEFSAELDVNGLPRWERPMEPPQQYGFTRPTLDPGTVNLLGDERAYLRERHENDTAPTKARRRWVRRHVPPAGSWEDVPDRP